MVNGNNYRMNNARYKDLINSIQIGRLYCDPPVEFSMSPKEAIYYEKNISPLIDNSNAGFDLLFTEQGIMRYYFFNVKLCIEFPSIDYVSGYNIPMFEIYMGSEFDGSDWVARFIPVYDENTTDFYTSSITQEIINESGLSDLFFSPANNEGYIGFTYTFNNIKPWLEAYEVGLNELNTFGIKFYFINLSSDGPNLDIQYKIKVKQISIGTYHDNLPDFDKGGRIIVNSSGPGAVYVNGVHIK